MKKLSLIFISLLFIAFKTGDLKIEYSIPSFAISICSDDLDLDGDIDIAVGHVYNFQTDWGGISLLENDGYGYFNLSDSIYLYGGQTNIKTIYLNNDEYPKILGLTSNGNAIKFAILSYQNGSYNTNVYPIGDALDCYTVGDINNDSHIDLVFSAGWEQYWGVIYNDGTGNFSFTQTFNVNNSFPNRIACGDLNNDDQDDIVMSGGYIKIWFNFYPDYFEKVSTNANISNFEIVDFDNDGDSDIVGYTSFTWGPYTDISFIENLGDTINTIGPITIDHKSEGTITVCDFNNDSLPEILLSKMDGTGLQIIRNNGNFEISEPKFIPIEYIGDPGRRTAANDFDGNGYNDIAIIRTGGDPFQPNVIILYNNGMGNFLENPITSINERNTDDEIIECFPNPCTSYTTIKYKVKTRSHISINIHNADGHLVASIENGIKTKGEYQIDYNSTELSPGIYHVSIYVNGIKMESKKILKI